MRVTLVAWLVMLALAACATRANRRPPLSNRGGSDAAWRRDLSACAPHGWRLACGRWGICACVP